MCVYTCVCVCVIGGYDVYDHITCFVHPCGHFLSVLMEVPSVRAVLFCVSVDIFPPMLSHLSGILSFCRPESDIAHSDTTIFSFQSSSSRKTIELMGEAQNKIESHRQK